MGGRGAERTIRNRCKHHGKVSRSNVESRHGDDVNDDTDPKTEHDGRVEKSVFLRVSDSRLCTLRH